MERESPHDRDGDCVEAIEPTANEILNFLFTNPSKAAIFFERIEMGYEINRNDIIKMMKEKP